MSAALTVRLNEATLDALDRLAEKANRPRDQLAAQAIEDFVAFDDWAVAKVERGLTAADSGDFATSEELARVRAKFAPEG